MKAFFLLTLAAMLLQLSTTTAPAAEYTYQGRGTGPISFTARVTLSYNTGFVTSPAQITFFDLSAPLDADAHYVMAGGTVTPASITQTGFILAWPPNPQYGPNDGQVFDELLQISRWNIVVVPEPSPIGLSLVGLGLLAFKLRRAQ